jgi:hypothetical protein
MDGNWILNLKHYGVRADGLYSTVCSPPGSGFARVAEREMWGTDFHIG